VETVHYLVFAVLVAALAAALFVMRRRAEQVELLRERLRAASNPDAGRADAIADEVDDLLPVGVIRFDASGRIVAANARAYALLEIAPGRLSGRSVMETFLDARVEGTLVGLPAGGTATTEIRAGDGEQRMVLLRARRGPGSALDVVLEDVTELRRLQQIRTEFIDNLSHELRTPLSTVSLLAETLARDAERADVPERMKERIAKVEVETGHLVQMVNELLDLARIEGGSQLRMDENVNLGRLAESSAERLRLFADRQGVTIAVEVAPDLPLVRGDEDRLGQVFVNLVHNAVKFSPEGGEVVIRVRRDGDVVAASVSDHGIGIAKADRTRVFERFYKTDRARVRGGGTGLGLSIARHVVQAHGGRIGVESEEGEGSTFTFTVPLHVPDPVQTTPPGRPSAA
jgi:two-component system, OmpR family, phosphate regulon sensor histidine kinase PhoR